MKLSALQSISSKYGVRTVIHEGSVWFSAKDIADLFDFDLLDFMDAYITGHGLRDNGGQLKICPSLKNLKESDQKITKEVTAHNLVFGEAIEVNFPLSEEFIQSCANSTRELGEESIINTQAVLADSWECEKEIARVFERWISLTTR